METGGIRQAEDTGSVRKAGVFLIKDGDEDICVQKNFHFLFEEKYSSFISLEDLFFVRYSAGPSATWLTQSAIGKSSIELYSAIVVLRRRNSTSRDTLIFWEAAYFLAFRMTSSSKLKVILLSM